jgi:hypothetical protein
VDKAKIAELRSKTKSRGFAKALDAAVVENKPVTQEAKADYVAITEGGIRGQQTIDRGDGKLIHFKDAAYHTNDPAEAKFLAAHPGITVTQPKKAAAKRGRVFTVPALPWKDKE